MDEIEQGNENALEGFLSETVIHEDAGAPVEPDLVIQAAIASGWILLLGGLGFLLEPPVFGPEWRQERYLLLAGPLNSLLEVFYQGRYLFLAIGLFLLGTTGVVAQVRTGPVARALCGALPVLAGVLSLPLGLVLISLVIYACLGVLAVIAVVAIVFGILIAFMAGA